MSHIGTAESSSAPRESLANGLLHVISEGLEFLHEDNPRYACTLVSTICQVALMVCSLMLYLFLELVGVRNRWSTNPGYCSRLGILAGSSFFHLQL
jgi:hypothetical protein